MDDEIRKMDYGKLKRLKDSFKGLQSFEALQCNNDCTHCEYAGETECRIIAAENKAYMDLCKEERDFLPVRPNDDDSGHFLQIMLKLIYYHMHHNEKSFNEELELLSLYLLRAGMKDAYRFVVLNIDYEIGPWKTALLSEIIENRRKEKEKMEEWEKGINITRNNGE